MLVPGTALVIETELVDARITAVPTDVDDNPVAVKECVVPPPPNAAVVLDIILAPASTTKPVVPLALTRLLLTRAAAETTKLAVAAPGSGIEITLAWPIAALLMDVTVLPVLATATNCRLPVEAVAGKDAKYPAVPDNPA